MTMCWGGGASSGVSREDLERAREKERLLLVDFDDDEEAQPQEGSGMLSEKKKAYVPQYAAASFLRTATSRPMKKRNEVV